MRRLNVLLCLCLASPARVALAADPRDPSAEARRHFEQGVALYNAGDFNGALAEFEASYRGRPLPEVRFNIGLTQKALFRYSEAIETLRRQLAEDGGLSSERRVVIDRLVREMEALLAPVTVRLSPASAQLLIDGRSAAAGVLRLPAGHHQLSAAAEGHRPLHREIIVSAGTPLQIDLALEPLQRTGRVRITSAPPRAAAEIDGSRAGATPVDAELPAGGHTLRLTAPGWRPYVGELLVGAGQQRQIEIRLERASTARSLWWLWTFGAIALAGAATAVAVTQSVPQSPIDGTLEPFRIRTVQ